MNCENLSKVGIVGAGVIGSSLACFYASQGKDVRLFDVDKDQLNRGFSLSKSYLKQMMNFQILESSKIIEAEKKIVQTNDLQEVADHTDFIHEAVTERYDVKMKVFTELDRICSTSTIIASSSSGLLMSKIQEKMKYPKRTLIAHPFNPPHLIPLVELVPGKQSDPEIISKIYKFFKSLGKIPVKLKKETPGHIANRLSAALWREAIDLVDNGVASVEDVDRALYAGPGLRWAFMGPHLIYHLGGGEGGYSHFIEHIGTAFQEYWSNMASWHSIPEEAKSKILSGIKEHVGHKNLDELNHWRDETLVSVIRNIHGRTKS